MAVGFCFLYWHVISFKSILELPWMKTSIAFLQMTVLLTTLLTPVHGILSNTCAHSMIKWFWVPEDIEYSLKISFEEKRRKELTGESNNGNFFLTGF